MARRSSRRHDDDGEDDDDEEETEPPRPRRASRRHRTGPRGVRPWAAGSATPDGEEDESPDEDGATPPRHFWQRRGEPVYWRARDSLWFEPLVALAIIVLLLVGLYAYTMNWPPMYVVESQSMQHGDVDQLGLINTGDLVLAAKINPTQIVPYTTGLRTGYQTYGEYGDVVLYHPNGDAGTPIIHRALLYVYANADGTYSVPSLNGLPCGSAPNAVYRTSGGNGCGTTALGGTLTLLHIGWRSVTVSVDLTSLGPSSGFLTMGDNNFDPVDPTQGVPDEPGLTTLVQQDWIVGVARGMLPWFGAVKLLLEGSASEVPPQSWQFLGLTIVLLVLIAFGLHYVAGSAQRRADTPEGDDGDDGDDEEEDDEPERPGRFRAFRLWRSRSPDDDPDDEGDEGAVPAGRGRPRPTVKKGGRGRAGSDRSEGRL